MTPELKAMMLEWLDSDDPIKRKHAENRLKIGDINTSLKDIASRPTVGESWQRLQQIKACPYRSVFPPCGCSGARCGLKWGAIVSIHDCLDCVRDHGVS